jgi:hypothetical protein
MDSLQERRKSMRVRKFAAVSLAVAALALTGASTASAVNSSSCTFEKGTTTCTDVHGSHGSTDTHHGNIGSSGKDTGGGSCKVTGSDHTC